VVELLRNLKSNIGGARFTKISAAFGASATGQKLPIFMLIPRSTPLKNEDGSNYVPPANVILGYKPNGIITQDHVTDYFEIIKDKSDIEDGNLYNSN
jgi:hypothetical protein